MTTPPDTPPVSVVMIFRDARRFLDEAVRSVLGQTYPHVELLLVDDGSTDVARAHRRARPDRVRLLAHPGRRRRGMSASRNLGIDGAGGADRVPRRRRRLGGGAPGPRRGPAARPPEAGMACGRALDWRSWDGGGAPDAPTPLPFAPGSVVPPPRMLTAVLRRGAYRTPTCSLLVRAAVVRRVGGAEDAFTGMFEDQALLAKLHLSAAAVVSGSLTARYRRHPGSATAPNGAASTTRRRRTPPGARS